MSDGFGTFTGVAYIINIMMGSGINFMPAAFNNSGICFALIILFVVACFTAFSIYALFRCASKYSGSTITYANLAEKCSPHLKLAINISMAVCSFFTALGFQKYIKELAFVFCKGILPNKSAGFYYHLEIVILMLTTIVLTCLSLVKNIQRWKVLPYLSVICVTALMATLTTFNVCLGDFISTVPSILDKKSDYLFSFSFFVIAMSVQSNIPMIFRNIRNKGKGNLLLIASLGSAFGFLLYGLAGYLGFRLMGDCIGTNDIIRMFVDVNSQLNVYLRTSNRSNFLQYLPYVQGIASAIILVVGFPLQLLPATDFFKEMVPIQNPQSPYFHRIIVLTEILTVTGINLIPDVPLDLVYGILGPTAVGLLSFFFPFLLYNLNKKRKKTFKSFLSFFIMMLSIGYFVFGSYLTLDDYFNTKVSENEFCMLTNNITEEIIN